MSRRLKDSGIEWIGDIPDDWEIGYIGQIYTERKQKVSDRDYVPLSVTMKGIVPQLSTAAKTDAHDDRKLVKKGDFAINSRSDRRGSCGIATMDGSISLINTVLKPKEEMNPNYYNWLFHTSMFSDEFYKWGHGIVDDLWTTNWSDMKKIAIPIPALKEQRTISSFLNNKCSYIDNIITKTQASIEEYKKLKQSIITQAVTKGVRGDREMKDSGIEWIGEIPSDWNVGKISYFYDVTLGKMVDNTESNEKSNYLCAANVKWTGVNTDVEKKMFFSDSEKEQYLLENGDILIMEGGMAGTACIYHGEFSPCYIQNSVHRCRPFKNDIGQFLYYWMFVVYHSGYISNICNKATIMHYTKEKVKATPYLVMSEDEQNEIVNYLDKRCSEIDSILEKKSRFIIEMETYKKSLIYEYVTGKKEVV